MDYQPLKYFSERIKRSDDHNWVKPQDIPFPTEDRSFSSIMKYLDEVQEAIRISEERERQTSPDPYDTIYNQKHDYNENLQHKEPRTFFWPVLTILITGTIVFVIILLACKCRQKRQNNVTQTNQQNATTRDYGFIPQVSASGNQVAQADFERPLIVNSNTSTDYSRTALHDANDGHVRAEGFVKDNSCTLPPSYDEAMANVAPTAPVCESASSPCAPPLVKIVVAKTN